MNDREKNFKLLCWHYSLENFKLFICFAHKIIDFRYDFLAIYDGPDSTSTRIGRYCGSLESSFSNLPSDKIIISTTKELFLQFTTDSSVVLKGFRISYKEIGKFLVCTANSKAHNFCHLVVNQNPKSRAHFFTLIKVVMVKFCHIAVAIKKHKPCPQGLRNHILIENCGFHIHFFAQS